MYGHTATQYCPHWFEADSGIATSQHGQGKLGTVFKLRGMSENFEICQGCIIFLIDFLSYRCFDQLIFDQLILILIF